MPVDLGIATRASLRGERTSAATPAWRRLLAPATVLVLAIATVAGGAVLIRGSLGSAAFVQFRDGPTPDLRTLDAGTFTFDFPADWLAYDAAAPFSGGSSIAVIGTQPVEARCGEVRQVDINCVYEQPLEPGDIRVFVGSDAYRGGTVLDRPDIENGTTARLTIGGMPAIRNDYDVQPDTYYREDVSMAWEIALPTSLGNVIRIEVRAREWPFRGRINTAAEVRAAVQTMVDSFRFTPPPVPLPADPSAAVAAARAAIQTRADGFRQGYVDPGSSALTYLDCLGDEPDTAIRTSVLYGPGGDLGRSVDLVCSWTVTTQTPSIWRLGLTFEWTADGRSGRYVETLWLDAASTAVASTFAGDPPPVAPPTSAPVPSPSAPAAIDRPEPIFPSFVEALPVIDVAGAELVRDRDADDREIAIHGWLSIGPPLSCAAPTRPRVSPLEPGCGTELQWLLQDPEMLVDSDGSDLTITDPVGPAIHPNLTYANAPFSSLDQAWFDALPAGTDIRAPWPVVVLGHFDDPMAAACRLEDRGICEDRFVIDRLAAIHGVPIPVDATIRDDEVVSVADEIIEILDSARPASPVLSLVPLAGGGLADFDPSLPKVAEQLGDEHRVWVVRVLDGATARSIYVVDDDHEIYLVSDSGGLLALADVPRQSLPPWPPAGSRVIELTSKVGEGRPPARVAIVDPAGWLASVREVRPDDPGLLDTAGAPKVALFDDPGHGGRFRLVWAGGLCDGDMTVTLERSARRIVVDKGLQPPCRLMGVGRQLVLEFTEAMDPGSIDVFYTETRSNQP